MPYNYDKQIEIRDFRNGDWFWVEKSVWENSLLTSSDKVVYGTLAFFSNVKTQRAFPSFKRISEQSGVSQRQAVYSIKKLERLRYIEIVEKGGGKKNPNVYKLLKSKYAEFAPNKTVQKRKVNYAKIATETMQNSTSNNNNRTIINNKRKILLSPTVIKGKQELYKNLAWETSEVK